MPSMPEPASATAIGTPTSSASTSTSMGSATIMCDLSPGLVTREWLCGGRRVFLEQIGLAAADPRQVDEHEQRQREEAQRDQAVGGADQHRKRAQRRIVVQ